MVATRDIALGERILAEPPLFTLAAHEYNAEAAEAAVRALSSEQQRAFYALCQSAEVYGEQRAAIHIFNNNSLPLGSGPAPEPAGMNGGSGTAAAAAAVGRSGVFPTTARVNHSCTPNVNHTWNANLGRETLHAGRAIKHGEELLTSYIQPAQTRDRRQAYLLAHFGFRCACGACMLEGEELAASNTRRSRLCLLEHQQQLTAGDLALGLRHVHDRMELLRAEGLDDPCMLMQAEFDAFQLCKLHGRHKDARTWLRHAYEHCVLAEGADSPRSAQYSHLLKLPLKATLDLGMMGAAGDPP